MKFKELHESLDLNYRRAYDILNVLTTTPLVSKRGKKRDNEQAYLFLDGEPLPDLMNLKNLSEQLEQEKQHKEELIKEIKELQMKNALATALWEEEEEEEDASKTSSPLPPAHHQN